MFARCSSSLFGLVDKRMAGVSFAPAMVDFATFELDVRDSAVLL